MRAGADSYSGEKPRNHEPGELLGFVSGRRRALRAGWSKRRWLPSDKIFSSATTTTGLGTPRKGSGADPDSGRGAGGVFIIADDTDPVPGEARFRTTTPRATRRPS